MSNENKSMDLGQVKADIAYRHGGSEQMKSMANAKNLTANNDLDEVVPVGDRIVVSLKAWPAQSVNGLFMPESYTVIRGDMYSTQVEAVGADVTLVKKGDVIIVSIYSGYHITTKTGHAKIISQADILIHKTKEDMEKDQSFDPKTFKPGINFILVEMIEKKQQRTASGIITEMGEDDALNKNDVATKTAIVLAKGEVDKFGKEYKEVNIGSTIIMDSYVGIVLNTSDVTDEAKYRIMLSNDILGYIEKK
jgi:co-chaperonin GroES (HSP10)